jgi:hypothetical protein
LEPGTFEERWPKIAFRILMELAAGKSGVHPSTIAPFQSLAALQKGAVAANKARMLKTKKPGGKPKNETPKPTRPMSFFR